MSGQNHDPHAVKDDQPAFPIPATGLVGVVDAEGAVWTQRPCGGYDLGLGDGLEPASLEHVAENYGPLADIRIVPADATVLPALTATATAALNKVLDEYGATSDEIADVTDDHQVILPSLCCTNCGGTPELIIAPDLAETVAVHIAMSAGDARANALAADVAERGSES